MFCPGCGRQVADTATFCPQCGRQLSPKEPANRIPAVLPKNVVVAVVAILVVSVMGLGISRIVGGGAPNPYKWLNMSSEKMAKKLNKLYELDDGNGYAYFSSEKFREYIIAADGLGNLGEVRIPKRYAGEYIVMVCKDGFGETMSKSELRLGLQPEGVVCIEVTRDKVPSANKFVNELKRRRVKYEHIFAAKLDDASDIVPFVSGGEGLSSLFYSDELFGASGLIDAGDVRLRADVALKDDAFGIQDFFENLSDSDSLEQVFTRLGIEDTGDYVLE